MKSAMKIRTEFFVPYLFLLPAIALLVIFNLIPAVTTFKQSLYAETVIRGSDPVFVGFKNFSRIFSDPVFWQSVKVSIVVF